MKLYFCSLFLVLFFATAGAVIWTGSTSNDWGVGSNWSSGAVPTSSTDVVIPTNAMNRYPSTLSALSKCNTLIVNNGASVTLSNYNLSVTLDASFSGRLNIIQGRTFSVNGSLNWASGSTANITHAQALISCYNDLTFASGSDVQFDSGCLEFRGLNDANLYNHSANTEFNDLRSYKSSGVILYLASTSTQPLVINGSLLNTTYSTTRIQYGGNITIKGDLSSLNTGSSGLRCSSGSIIMDGSSQTIALNNSGDYLNNLVISPSTSVTLNSDLSVKLNLSIQSGSLIANHDLSVGGNWTNSMGPAAFTEGDGSQRVIFNGTIYQYIQSNESFNILEIDKSGGALRINDASQTVSCAQYDWTAGALEILSGTFSIDDLVDDGLWGSFTCNPNGVLNISNYDGNVDLCGHLNISGGNVNIYGGLYPSYWPYMVNSSVTMSGGILDFKNQGIYLNPNPALSFSSNISGGEIRVNGYFRANRPDFNPTGGLIYLYGSADSYIEQVPGANFHNLTINKYSAREDANSPEFITERDGTSTPITRSNTLNINSNLDINGSFLLQNGQVNALSSTVNLAGDCNIMSSAVFNAGSGTFVLDGSAMSVISNAAFNHLVLSKSGDGGISLPSSSNVASCGTYDWTSGALLVEGGSFTAYDMIDPQIMGTVTVSSGSIHFHQESTPYLYLNGTLNISNTGELHIYADQYNFTMPYFTDGNASFNMSGGLLKIHNVGITFSGLGNLNTNITGGVIELDNTLFVFRNDFQPSGGTFRFKGSDDANLHLDAGSTLHSVEIDKSSRSGGDDRNRNNKVTLINDLTVTSYMEIISGGLDMGFRTLSIDGYLECSGWISMHNSAARIKTINPSSGSIYFMSGSGAYFSLGTIECGRTLVVQEGANIVMSAPVLIRMTNSSSGNITNNEPDCQLGSVELTGGGLYQLAGTADHLMTGYLTINAGSELRIASGEHQITCLGTVTIQDMAALTQSAGSNPSFVFKAGLADQNTILSSTRGFNITSGTISFEGPGLQYVSCPRPQLILPNLTIFAVGGSFNPSVALSVNGDINLLVGTWTDQVPNLTHVVCGNLVIGASATYTPAMGSVISFEGGTDSILTDYSSGFAFHILRVDKTNPANTLSLSRLTRINPGGALQIERGTLLTNGQLIRNQGGTTIGDGAILSMNAGSILETGDNQTVSIGSGGVLECNGTALSNVILRPYSGHWMLTANDGATISATFTGVDGTQNQGINILYGATVDPAGSFVNCCFQNGAENSAYLSINNAQDLLIPNASFLTPISGGCNVAKNQDNGTINLSGASGAFAGPAYEHDPHNRVHWAGFQPNLLVTSFTCTEANPYIGDLVDYSVTILNDSDNPAPEAFNVHLFINRASAPGFGETGDQLFGVTSLGANASVNVSFSGIYTMEPAVWDSYALIDPEAFITESDENDNCSSPLLTTWNALPPVQNAALIRVADTLQLSWSYPIGVSRFRILWDNDPCGSFANLLETTTLSQHSFSPISGKRFYRIVAERDSPTP